MNTITFEINDDNGTFRDAIVLPDNHGLTEKQIESIKQSRHAAWVEMITAVNDEAEENNG
jgi:hypothetical protein